MQKVVTINLNGNAYQLDETAFAALRAYLDHAEARLKDNADRAEILADLEQAIAEKCSRFLGPHKTVILAAEMDQVVKEMGPVEEADGPAASSSAPTGDTARPTDRVGPKRLYRIPEGAMWAGVCNGIAAYIHVDVVFVRIAFVVVTVVSLGWGALGYWALAFIIPEAYTADERAAAHGEAPFNAQDVIDEAKGFASEIRDHVTSSRRHWRRQIRQRRRDWRLQSQEWRRQWRARAEAHRTWDPAAAFSPVTYSPPPWTGLLLPIFSVVNLALVIAMVLTILSLVSTGAVFGLPLPAGMPMWAGLLILVVLFQFVAAPIRAARHLSHNAWGGYYSWFAVWDGLFVMGVTVVGMWLLFRHMPPVHDLREFTQNLPDAIKDAGQDVVVWFKGLAAKSK
jgi:phage shock protein PspC (stress-responsive transcriptional regulator)